MRIGPDRLPHWTPPEKNEEYPFVVMTGPRIQYAIHSRCHKVPQLRRLRPEPLVDINPKMPRTWHY